MDGTKKWYQSRGVIGSMISIIALAASFVGYKITPAEQVAAVELTLQAIALGGALLAWYGRIKATKRIG